MSDKPTLKVICENNGRIKTYTNVDEVSICVDNSRLADDELAIDFKTPKGKGRHTNVQYISIPEYEFITICIDE